MKSWKPSLLRIASGWMRATPQLICAGAMRCGTTTLWRHLNQHPDFVDSNHGKELHFFDNTRRRQKTLHSYRACFPMSINMLRHSREAFTVDITPSYFFMAEVPPYIARLLPDARILVLMRDPTNRAISHYYKKQAIRGGGKGTTAGLKQDIQDELELARKNPQYAVNHQHILGRGRYLEQIQRFEAVFPRSQLLYICSEKYHADQQEWLDRIADFAGVRRWQIAAGTRGKKQHYEMPDSATLDLLDSYFAPYNATLFEHLGQRFPWGKQREQSPQNASIVSACIAAP